MTKRKLGIVLILTGLLLAAAALTLHLHNQTEEKRAADSVQQLMPQVAQSILQRVDREEEAAPGQTYGPMPDPDRDMPVALIDGQAYIGYLTIPALELELPVMADWSYPQLQIAPCRYAGSVYRDNLVLMAHNYEKHFGRIDELRPGDRIQFVDMDGTAALFEVAALDILDPAQIEDMTSGDYALTLFTCTYGGKSRVTVRCDRV